MVLPFLGFHVLEALVTVFLGFFMALDLPRCMRFMSGDTKFETWETENTMEFVVMYIAPILDHKGVRTRGVSYLNIPVPWILWDARWRFHLFMLTPILGKIPNFTSIVQRGWFNHQPDTYPVSQAG